MKFGCRALRNSVWPSAKIPIMLFDNTRKPRSCSRDLISHNRRWFGLFRGKSRTSRCEENSEWFYAALRPQTSAFLDVRRRSLSTRAQRPHRSHWEGEHFTATHRHSGRFLLSFSAITESMIRHLLMIKLVQRVQVACLQPLDWTHRCCLPLTVVPLSAAARLAHPHRFPLSFIQPLYLHDHQHENRTRFSVADILHRQNLLIHTQPPACHSRPAAFLQSRAAKVSQRNCFSALYSQLCD